MEPTYWQKQANDQPLFPDLLWSQPENRLHAGKLLIIGGNLHGFAAPAEAYAESQKAGIGSVRVLLPDSLQKIVGKIFEGGEFAASTPSGSFSQKALGEFLGAGEWANGVLLAGDLGKNSETAVLLEKFGEKYAGQLTVTKDAADYVVAAPQKSLGRPETTLVLNFAQVQKLTAAAKFPHAFTSNMDFLQLVGMLHNFSETYPATIIVKHLDTIFAASRGRVSSTKIPEKFEIWRVKTAAHAAVWQLQNPGKPFEAASTALFGLFGQGSRR
jgi:NAD(P)H-hydrate repair Nnr-like enzyme with NAD(P)H-hydrate dehydratase domain